MITLSNLNAAYKDAVEKNLEYMAIMVTIPGAPDPELIINSEVNFESKMNYYNITYDELLFHRKAEGVRIVGFAFADDYPDLYDALNAQQDQLDEEGDEHHVDGQETAT